MWHNGKYNFIYFQDVADVDILKAMTSRVCGVPHITDFVSAGALSGLYITGGTVIAEVDVILISTYYIFNYPNAYGWIKYTSDHKEFQGSYKQNPDQFMKQTEGEN